MSKLDALMAEVESDEGYLPDWWMVKFAELGLDDIGPREAARFLTQHLPALKQYVSCMSVEIVPAMDWRTKPIQIVFFSTGGWSGAEELIAAALGKFWIKHLQTQWNRGGHYQFEVPILSDVSRPTAPTLSTPTE